MTELKQKAKSWRYWLRGLIDSIVIGSLTSVVAGLGLETTGQVDGLSWALVGTLAASGALVRLAQFWVQNPLTSLE